MKLSNSISPDLVRVFARHRWLVFLAVGVLLTGLIASVYTLRAYADSGETRSSERVVTLYDRGLEQSFATEAATIGEALDEVDVVIGDRDQVEPARSEELIADSYTINVYRARPLLVVDGNERQVVMTAAQSPERIATDAGIELYDEDVTTLGRATDMLVDGVAEQFVIDRATPVQLTLYGETFETRTQAKTVGGMLAEKHINLSKKDRVSLPSDTPVSSNMKLRVWREGKQTITRDEVVDFETETIQDRSRPAGYRKVETPGVAGERSVTYELTIQDGKEVKRKEISSMVKKRAKKQVEVVGAKFNYKGGKLSEKQITALGTCESGMTASRNSGNGFYGAFQFMPSTWHAVAPAPYNEGMPHEAPMAAQKQAVQNLLSGSSIDTQFPGCARQMRASGTL